MKVVHVLKRIEIIDNDIKDLRKLEKSISRDKSFSTPIYMSIEKQINILLGERIKLLELAISNPPENLVEQIEGPDPAEPPKAKKKSAAPKKSRARKKAEPPQKKQEAVAEEDDDLDDDDEGILMLTQDLIDEKIQKIETSPSVKKRENKKSADSPRKDEILSSMAGSDTDNDDHVKLLDVALEKGTLRKQEIEKDKEKKVRFFRENFPVE